MGGFIRYHCSWRCDIAFKNPKVLGGEIITVKQTFLRQLPTNDESVASKGQALGSISSRLGVENEHRIRAIPFPLRFVEIGRCLIFQIRIDADGDNQRRGFTVRHDRTRGDPLLCTRFATSRTAVIWFATRSWQVLRCKLLQFGAHPPFRTQSFHQIGVQYFKHFRILA